MTRAALIAGVLGLLFAAPAAHAADASLSGATLTFVAADGEANVVTVALAAGTYTVADAGATVTPGNGCSAAGANAVTCPSAGITALNIDGRDLDDTIAIGSGTVATTLTGGGGTDVLTGGDAADTLTGGGDGDTLTGGGAADTLNGDSGDDTLVGGNGADVFNGGAGTDTADFSARASTVTVSIDGTNNDGAPGELDNVKTDMENVVGGAGNDTILGGAPINLLSGGPGQDSLDGEAANDVLDGGADADVLTGGAGTDTVSYAARTAPVLVTLDGLAGDGEAGEGDTVRTDVETIAGGAGADALTGGALADTLSGGGGADTLSGGPGADTLNGDDGDDVLDGGAGGDVHNGGAGLDTADYSARLATVTLDLDGAADDGETSEADNVRADVERVLGGDGDDTLTGNNGTNVLSGGAGDDILDPGRGTGDELAGGAGVDTVTYATRTLPVTADPDGLADDGETGDNHLIAADVENLTGGSGNDRLTGTTAANLLSGGSGNDVLDGGTGADLLLGGAGADTADYSSRTTAVLADPDGAADDGVLGEGDTIETDVENLAGGTGDDQLTGALGTNIIVGGNGADTLDGAQGDDDLDGGAGNDELTGGSGADLLRGGPGTDRLAARDGGSDRVRCEGGTDTAILDAIDDVIGDCEATDVPATIGPSGPQGPTGPTGGTGPGGSDGTKGKDGKDGAPGPAGAQGPQGAAGRDAVVTCKPKGTKKVRMTCTVQLAGATGSVRAALLHGGRVVSRTSAHARAGAASLRLARRHLSPGRYRLRLTYTAGGKRTTVTRGVSIH